MLIMNVKLPKETELLLLELSHLPQKIPVAIKRGLDSALQLIVGRIQLRRLSGTGPFPVSEHRLGVRSGLLQRTTRAIPAVIQSGGAGGDPAVTGEIRSDTFYADVHEFGKVIRGKPVMKFKIGTQWIRARRVVIPERAPFRTEILGNTQLIADEIVSELQDAVAKL